MAFFTELTTSLKQKWLQYFQSNRSWLERQMEAEYIDTPDGGRRPSSYLILGAVSALEPQLAELIVPFTKLNPDINALIDVLELNFDPVKSQSDRPNLQSDRSVSTVNPHSNSSVNPSTDMDELMEVGKDEALQPQGSSWVEVVDRTAPATSQQQPLEKPNAVQTEMGDVWLDEMNAKELKSEQTPDKTHTKEGKQSEDEEISRLFPEF